MCIRDRPDLPPEEIVEEVTPWKRAMNRVLVGMALSTVTLNFLLLDTILPAIGVVLMLLGFRSLRCENRWFRSCFALTPVSYTHLDVYKRQSWTLPTTWAAL